MQRLIFLDESGDLGWKFDAPFGKGGSSRHLTIASAFTCIEAKKHLARTIINLKKKAGWAKKDEMKWVHTPHELRLEFCEKAAQLCEKHQTIEYRALVIAKQGVLERLRHDDAMLYNYLIKCSLLEPISRYQRVTLFPDPRGIAPNAGHPLSTYLQGRLYEKFVDGHHLTELGVKQIDSAAEYGIQFADMLAGAIQLHYEGKTSEYFDLLRPCLRDCKELYFPRPNVQQVWQEYAANEIFGP
ncbi:DUF3800 domain-containing protein [Salinicola corii]|uniref:DUF3800 domain-containing protein n=1 Tax=Salinicola corii TaxID=2606937 RepID=A0A640WC01_9GAMM|nr:DUF3800 domain-containing protein [Salinicola corii]KAA0017146.1 DUF3800 domain-containing protein [Salinicola corii]